MTFYNLKKNEKKEGATGTVVFQTLFPKNGVARKSIALRTLAILLVTVIIIIANTFANSLPPYLIKSTIDTYIPAKDIIGLNHTILLAICIVLANIVLQYCQTSLVGHIGQNILFDLRRRLFAKLQELPVQFFSENKSGDIIQRITNDVQSVNNMLSEGIQRGISTIFKVIVTGAVLVFLNPTLSLYAFLPIIAVIVLLWVEQKPLKNKNKAALDATAMLTSVVQETVSSLSVIKAFRAEEYANKRFLEKQQVYFKKAMHVSFLASISNPIIALIIKAGTIFVVFKAFTLLATNAISIGTILSFVVYTIQFYVPLGQIGQIWQTIQSGLAATERMSELLTLETNIKEVKKPYKPERSAIQGKIEFKNAKFSYDSENAVLENINFVIEPREKVAIVGPTGGGKSTFVNLVTRLYDTASGTILIDDVDVKKWKIETLRKNTGYLLQDTFFFEDTIENNLRYANAQVTEEKIWLILKKLKAEKFVKNLEKGLNTIIRPDDSTLSVGQKQLLSITRTLLRDPKILILDEATASIDSRSEKIVQEAIDIATQNVTSLIIAHRLSTIENVDKVILIKSNKILEAGPKDVLLEKKGEFYNLYRRFKPEKAVDN